MKTPINTKNFTTLLLAGLSTGIVFAQAGEHAMPPVPPAAPLPAVAAEAPTNLPTPAEAPATPKPKVAEGTLFKSQRVPGDKGGVGSDWVCTYRVGGASKSVQLNESCPDTMRFELKR